MANIYENEKEKFKDFDYSHMTTPCCVIAEDSPTIQKYYEALLKKMKVNLIIAKNGKDALAHLEILAEQGTNIDFIIVDIMMPGMNGMELLEHLSKIAFFNSTPIMISSAMSDRETAMKLIKQYKPAAYIVKPINAAKFITTIRDTMLKGKIVKTPEPAKKPEEAKKPEATEEKAEKKE